MFGEAVIRGATPLFTRLISPGGVSLDLVSFGLLGVALAVRVASLPLVLTVRLGCTGLNSRRGTL